MVRKHVCFEDFFFVGEGAVDVTQCQIGLLRDLTQGGGGVALLHEQRIRGCEQGGLGAFVSGA